jgi:hypothetical protein
MTNIQQDTMNLLDKEYKRKGPNGSPLRNKGGLTAQSLPMQSVTES